MTDQNSQEILDRLLADLTSGDETRELAALHELGATQFSSPAIVLQLEQLALNSNRIVRKAALGALLLTTNQFVAGRNSELVKYDRQKILKEIGKWRKAGLLSDDQAEVLSRRYDFDLTPGIPIRTPEARPVEKPEPVAEVKAAPAASTTPAQPFSKPVPVPAPKPAEPRPSLTQVLLSETSIRIYLYLGAFFVIASAAILAALVEAARLPILLVATLTFAGGAVGFKKRLPQPSFAFAIVFSFLLPIDAGVIADNMNLAVQSNHGYWSIVFMLMAGIWVLGTWFYESRMFSLAAFAAFMLGATRFVSALALDASWVVFATGTASLCGWFGAFTLKGWKELKFAQPLFLAAQLAQILTLAYSLEMLLVSLFDSGIPADGWIAHTLTWLLAASFYAASRILFPFILFPWMSAASLFLVPALLVSAFDASATVYSAGFVLWGALMAFASEFAQRSKQAELKHYHFPWLALSLPLFFVSVVWGFSENIQVGFAAFLGTAVVYTLLNFLRPRAYVWTTALVAGLGTYFSFFVLPFMQTAEVYFGYQLLGASLLLLVPELFFFKDLPVSTHTWRLPPLGLGILVTFLNLWGVYINLFGNDRYALHTAIILGVYALLFAAHALRFKQPLLGYLSTAALTVALHFVLTAYKLDLWMPAFTALALAYYLAGFLLARHESLRAWGSMLLRSGLVLGALAAASIALLVEPNGGWYALVIAVMFVVELYTRRVDYLEFFPPALASIALVIFLNDFRINELAYYLFGVGLIWLTGDALFRLTLSERKIGLVTKGIGGLIALAAVIQIVALDELDSFQAGACFAVYTAFFAAYALIHKTPALGYLSTAAAAVTTFYALDHFKVEAWMPVFTGLTLIYYFAGFFLRKQHSGWAEMFRYSGLALGGLVSLAALVNLEATGGWYAAVVGGLLVLETVSTRDGRFEAGVYIPFSIAAFLILRDFNIHEVSYILLAVSLVWLGGDVIFEKTFKERKVSREIRLTGGGIAALNAVMLLNSPSIEAAICFGVYALFFALYAWFYQKSWLGYAATGSLPLSVFFTFRAAGWNGWLFAVIAIAALYYMIRYFTRRAGTESPWGQMFLFSGLGLGTVIALVAPFQSGGIENALPIAVAATLFAAEAWMRRNVWLAFPANGLYLLSYFVLLVRLNVNEPQYFSIGAAVLGMFMHFLLVRAKSKTGAFLMGTLSQLVLLGTTYIQMISTGRINFFFFLFAQSLAVLAYGIVMRSRSLVIAPIGFAVLGVVTVLYSALRGISLVYIIGGAGLILLSLGILAVLMRERITTLAERFSDWDA